jgi:uncharacterized protein YutE (UPF0331/DUF86 family)
VVRVKSIRTGARDYQEGQAGYRNRIVHSCAEITEEEIYNIIQEELQDLHSFCAYIDQVLRDPRKFNLLAE